MKWWVMRTCVVLGMALGGLEYARAQRPPETHPSGTRQDVVMAWDRSAMPGDIELWAARTVLGYARQESLGYGELFLTCNSNSNAATGRCPTTDTLEDAAGTSSRIPVRFTEHRSGMHVEVEFTAEIRRADATAACSLDYWSRSPRPVWSSVASLCNGSKPVGTGAQLQLRADELGRLFAGRWTATLELKLHKPPLQYLASYIFSFEFTVTDHDAVAIYFPAFDQATPHVGLNLQYDPLSQTVGGSTQLDMCLYDGLGSQSQYLGVTVRDTGTRPPGATGYSVWHGDGGNDDRQRMDYTVSLDHSGTRLMMVNGVEQPLRGIDTAKLRLVMLPGTTQPVFCVPTPLILQTPRVPIASKRPGYYDGDLQVELRVPTATP